MRVIDGPRMIDSHGDDAAFDYVNLSGRPRPPLLAAAGRLLPGIARVHAEVAPFAEAWQRDNRAALAAPSTTPLWVALGDSLSLGVGAPAYDRGWVGQVRDRLAGAGLPHRVVNLAFSGARADDVLERQLPALTRLPPPDLVTLMIGSNDLLRRRHRRGLPARVGEILARVPSGTVVATLPNPTAAAEAVNQTVAGVARERGLVVAELRDRRTASWRGRLAADHFHPNEHGYAAIAAVVGDALLRVAAERAGHRPAGH